ncbi:MAG: YfcE family phosphodiesterase, partial [Planctomycetaceae bacterium]|nr:YfcE family phosphodiesterase [Planctomycetaceae bacterium]
MYIGVISDTHGNILLAHQAMLVFREFAVERIIHCGDVGAATVLSQFAGTPVDFVLGNCDGSEADFRQVLEPGRVTCHGLFGHVAVTEKKIAFMHGHDQRRFDRETSSGRWDMLCYGHTHKPALWMGCDQTIVLNPGAFHRVATPSVAVVKLPEREVTHVNLT